MAGRLQTQDQISQQTFVLEESERPAALFPIMQSRHCFSREMLKTRQTAGAHCLCCSIYSQPIPFSLASLYLDTRAKL
jgi:hypothetical protein